MELIDHRDTQGAQRMWGRMSFQLLLCAYVSPIKAWTHLQSRVQEAPKYMERWWEGSSEAQPPFLAPTSRIWLQYEYEMNMKLVFQNLYNTTHQIFITMYKRLEQSIERCWPLNPISACSILHYGIPDCTHRMTSSVFVCSNKTWQHNICTCLEQT